MLSHSEFKNHNNPLEQIPTALLSYLLTMLDFADVVTVRKLNSFLKTYIENPALWKMKLQQEMGYETSSLPRQLTNKTYARLYARLSALRELNPKLYNDVRNFVDMSECEFECESKLEEKPNDTPIKYLPHLSNYPPIFSSTYLNLHVEPYLTNSPSKYFIYDSLQAGNIPLATYLIKNYQLPARFVFNYDLQHHISDVFKLGRLSAMDLLDLPKQILFMDNIAGETATSANHSLIEIFLQYLAKTSTSIDSNWFVRKIADTQSANLIDYVMTQQHIDLKNYICELNRILSFGSQLHVLRETTHNEFYDGERINNFFYHLLMYINQDNYAQADNLIDMMNPDDLSITESEWWALQQFSKPKYFHFIYRSRYQANIINYLLIPMRINKVVLKFTSDPCLGPPILMDALDRNDLNYLQWLVEIDPLHINLKNYLLMDESYSKKKFSEFIEKCMAIDNIVIFQYLQPIIFNPQLAFEEQFIASVTANSTTIRNFLEKDIDWTKVTQDQLDKVISSACLSQVKWFIQHLKAHEHNLTIRFDRTAQPSVFVYMLNELKLQPYRDASPIDSNLVRHSIYYNPKVNQPESKEELQKLMYPRFG